MIYFIYILKHPETKEVVYVGLTNKPEQRHYDHRRNFRKQYGYIPTMEIVDSTTDGYGGREREKEQISYYAKVNPNLINIRRSTPIIEQKNFGQANTVFANLVSQVEFITGKKLEKTA